MGHILYHGVKVRWNDGGSEMLRYDTGPVGHKFNSSGLTEMTK